MYPQCVAFLRKNMRVREIVILVHLSHSHGFAQKRNAFRIHGTACPYYSFVVDIQYFLSARQCCQCKKGKLICSVFIRFSNLYQLI